MPLCILVVSSVPRSYSTYVGDTGTVRKLFARPLRRAGRPIHAWQEREGNETPKAQNDVEQGAFFAACQRRLQRVPLASRMLPMLLHAL